MLGAWAKKLYYPSHDGRLFLCLNFDGFTILDETGKARQYKLRSLSHAVSWSPDNKKLMFSLPEGVALADVADLGEPGGPAKTTLIYKISADRQPYSEGWSPAGNEIFILEHYKDNAAPNAPHGSAVERVTLTGQATEILRSQTRIAFFAIPRGFEEGTGPSSQPFKIIIGGLDGLYTVDPNGQGKEKLSDLVPDGIEDLVWSPDNQTFAFLLWQPQLRPDKRGVYKGAYLVRLDKQQGGKPLELEQLTDKLDVHTIYYSPKGKRIVWASNSELRYRDVNGRPDSTVKVEIKDASGDIKGCHWDASEGRIAIVVGNRLYVHEVAGKVTILKAKLGDDAKSFGANPRWVGDDVVLSLYTDTGTGKK
jgi:dipeptidyl aminopeptidase/acylaminoacyl peptidase